MAVWSELSISSINSNYGRIDSEYYRPEFIKNDNILDLLPTRRLKGITNRIDVGYVGSTVQHYRDKGILLLQTQNVQSFFLDLTNTVKIDEIFHNKLKKSKVQEGDILLARSGSFGKASIYLEKEVINSADIIIINIDTTKDMDNLYCLAFINSEYGQNQLLRYASGAVQRHINLKILEDFRIPFLNKILQHEISGLISDAYSKHKKAQYLYIEAQHIIDADLGLNELKFDKSVGSETVASAIFKNNRTDAEFYQTRFTQLLSVVLKYKNGYKPFYDVAEQVLPNFVPHIRDANYKYLEIGDVSVHDGSYNTNLISAKDLPANAKIKLSGGELVISQVRPTRGAIAIIDDVLDYDTICSGAFFVCRILDANSREIIWLYLRSIKNVFEKYCGGTSYPTIESYYLRKFSIPNFETDISLKIKALITESIKARLEAKQLLEQAKKRVEKLIKEAVIS